MHEDNTTFNAAKPGRLLNQVLQMIRSYRHILPRFSDSPFVSLITIMISDHEKSARDLRGHVDENAKPFVDPPALPFHPEFARDFDLDQSMDSLEQEESKALRECETMLGDGRYPEGLRACLRDSLVPKLENHIGVLRLMASCRERAPAVSSRHARK